MFKRLHLPLPPFLTGLVIVLFLSAIYVYAFPAPTLLYAAAVLLHAGLGLMAAISLLPFCLRHLRSCSSLAKLGWLFLTLGALFGVALIYLGATRPMFRWLYLHIALCMLGLVLLAANVVSRFLMSRSKFPPLLVNAAAVVVLAFVAGGLAFSAQSLREGSWLSSHVIRNPEIAPENMNGEGDGPNGLFFP